jgi:predicted PurR-regulated permease PerM
MMQAQRGRPETWLAAIWSLLVRVTVVAVLAYALWRVQFIIVVILVSAMLALTLRPVIEWLQRTRLMQPVPRSARRSIATTVVFLITGALLVQVGISIVKPLVTEISAFAANWGMHQAAMARWMESARGQYDALPPDVRAWIESQGFGDVGTRLAAEAQHVLLRTLHSGMLVLELILIPVLAFSFLTESRPLKRELAQATPAPRLRETLYLLRQVGAIFESYAIGQLILALIAGVVVWVMLQGLGVRYALAMAVLAATTRVIPVIGPILGGVPIIVLTALDDWRKAVVVLVLFTLMHLLESKVVIPRLIGYLIKLHPAVVIFVLLIGAEFFGMWGMFLAAPVAAVIKVLFQHYFVRQRTRGSRPRPAAPAPVARKEIEVERPAVAGIGHHSGAH